MGTSRSAIAACLLVIIGAHAASGAMQQPQPVVQPRQDNTQATQVVASPGQLLRAFLNSTAAPNLVLNVSQISLGAEQWPNNFTATLQRNLSVQNIEGTQPTFSFGSGAFAKLRLAPGVRLSVAGVELVGMYGVKGAPFTTLDVLAASPDSTLELRDAVLNNLACYSLPQLADALQGISRAPDVPGSQVLRQVPGPYCMPMAHMNNAAAQGQEVQQRRCFPGGSVLVQDWATRPPTTGDQGGYTFIMRNVSVVCSSMVTEDCLKTNTIYTCISNQLSNLDLATGLPHLPDLKPALVVAPVPESHGSKGMLGAVLGAAAGGVALIGMGVAVYMYRTRKGPWRRRGCRSTGSTTRMLSSVGGTTSTCADGGADRAQASDSSTEQLRVGEMIGCGSFGRVYRGRWRARDVAIKKILHSPSEAHKISREIALSMALIHPYVVQSLDCVTQGVTQPLTSANGSGGPGTGSGSGSTPGSALQQPGHGSGYMFPSVAPGSGSGQQPRRARDLCLETWLVQELCDQGPLSTALYGGRFKEPATGAPLMPALLLRARDVAAAMEWLHARGVCHGDLKSDNVLLQTDPSDPFGTVAKLCDFGLARALAEGRSHASSRHFGTITHMSPEVLVSGRLRPSSDVYSYGVLLWEMATGSRPWAGLTQGEIVHRVVVDHTHLAFPARTLHSVKALATQCWDKSPEARPDFTTIRVAVTAMIKEVAPEIACDLAGRWTAVDALAAEAAAAPGLRKRLDVDLAGSCDRERAQGRSEPACPVLPSVASEDLEAGLHAHGHFTVCVLPHGGQTPNTTVGSPGLDHTV